MTNEPDTRETYNDDPAPTSVDNDFPSSSVPQPSSSQDTESTIMLRPPSQNVEKMMMLSVQPVQVLSARQMMVYF